MSKYIKVSIQKKEYENGDVRYEIYWTKQHSFFGITINKYSEVKDYITFEHIEQAKDYVNNVTKPIRHRNFGEGYFDYILYDYPLTVSYHNKNAVYDRFLFYEYNYTGTQIFSSLEEYKKCTIGKTISEYSLNK